MSENASTIQSLQPPKVPRDFGGHTKKATRTMDIRFICFSHHSPEIGCQPYNPDDVPDFSELYPDEMEETTDQGVDPASNAHLVAEDSEGKQLFDIPLDPDGDNSIGVNYVDMGAFFDESNHEGQDYLYFMLIGDKETWFSDENVEIEGTFEPAKLTVPYKTYISYDGTKQKLILPYEITYDGDNLNLNNGGGDGTDGAIAWIQSENGRTIIYG